MKYFIWQSFSISAWKCYTGDEAQAFKTKLLNIMIFIECNLRRQLQLDLFKRTNTCKNDHKDRFVNKNVVIRISCKQKHIAVFKSSQASKSKLVDDVKKNIRDCRKKSIDHAFCQICDGFIMNHRSEFCLVYNEI